MASILKFEHIPERNLFVFVVGLLNGKVVVQSLQEELCSPREDLIKNLQLLILEPLVEPREVDPDKFLVTKAILPNAARLLEPPRTEVDVDQLISDVMAGIAKVVVRDVVIVEEEPVKTREIAIIHRWIKIESIRTVSFWAGYDPIDQEWLVPRGR
jgi:hypothetical protein